MFKIEKCENKQMVKTIRFSSSLIKKIEKESKKNNITFSRFVVEACIYALDNMEDKTNLREID